MSVIFTSVGIYIHNFKIITFSNKITALITVTGISLSVLSVSFISSFIGYVLIYGILFGLFIGYGYMAPLKNSY